MVPNGNVVEMMKGMIQLIEEFEMRGYEL